MRYTKHLTLLIFFLTPFTGYAQNLDSLLYDYLVLDKQWDPDKIRQDTSIHIEDILAKIPAYYSYPDHRVRSNAFFLTYQIMGWAKMSKDKILQFALECPCHDRDYSNRRVCFRHLTKFEKSAFTEKNINLLREIIQDDDSIGEYIILLVGYLDLVEYKDIIARFLERESGTYSFKYKSLAAQLSLTRMGEQQYIDGILAHIQNEKMSDRVIFKLQYLAYVQHDKATDAIVDILINGDKHLPKDRTEELYGKEEAEKMRKWCDSDVISYSLRGAGVLGKILKDTPIQAGRAGASYSQLEVARNWIKSRDETAAWVYNKNTFWAAY